MNLVKTFFLLILLSLVMLFFVLFAESAVLRVIAIVIPCLIIGSFIHSLVSSFFVEVTRDEEVIRGIKLKEMMVQLRVRNRVPFPITYFTLSDARGELFTEGGNFLISLGPWEKKTLTYSITGHQRGYYEVGPVTIKGSDFLGLYPWSRRFDIRSHVVVFPSIYPLSLINNLGLPAGNLKINNKMYEDVTQFRSLREYVPGDDMKRINWKASAKTTKLYTMEYDSTLYFPVLVVLDFSLDDYPNRYKVQLLERAAEVAASVAFYYIDIKQEIGFISTGHTEERPGDYVIVPSKSGYEHAQEIMEVIARIQPSKGRSDLNHLFYQSGVHIPMGVKVLVVTPQPTAEQARVLIGLKRRGINIQVMKIESSIAREEEDHISGALKVININDMGRDMIHG